MKKIQAGFTLIELMVVVAIVGVLVSFALPAYQDYTTRAKISEGLTLSAALKTAITESFQTKGPSDMSCTTVSDCLSLGTNPLDVTVLAQNTNVASILSNAAGVIEITYKSAVVPAGANILIIEPVRSDGTPLALNDLANVGVKVNWQCGKSAATTLNVKFRPRTCI